MSPEIKKEDDDEEYVEYDVYITEDLSPASLMLLQFPNTSRLAPLNAKNGTPPTEFRIKHKTGFVELDVPTSNPAETDLHRSKNWGGTLKKVAHEASNGFGIAGGFEQGSGAKPRLIEAKDEDSESDFLATQTLGGQIFKEEDGKPRYMIGTFRNNEIHLTPLEYLVQMRSQFHHIDAAALYDRIKSRPAVPDQARAVTASRPQNDNEDHAAAAAKRLMDQAKGEPWDKLEYVDEDDEESYDQYTKKMHVQVPEWAKLLTSTMKNAEYLDFIAPRKNGPARRLSPTIVDGALEISSDEDEDLMT